jgi:uroporphyrinogen-III synthase
MATLVTTHGGQPISAPSMREVPLESNTEALAFADGLERGEFDLVILLTGVGTRALLATVEHVRGTRERFVHALRQSKVVARGPKPLAVLREIGAQAWLTAPEPNTWREVIAALDSRQSELSLTGLRVAVQEYGVSNLDLLAALSERGARVVPVPVYQWALPEDLGPLRAACRALVSDGVDVVLFTTATQVVHLLKVAETMGLAAGVVEGLRKTVVASIGPTTSEELREHGTVPDMEPSHPKMGLLVREASERAGELLKAKRAGH